MYLVGCDVGGTFTDFVLLDAGRGFLATHKVLSTPDDPSRAVWHGLLELLGEHSVDLLDVEALVHATTVATNTLIERKGARTALLASQGFPDILEMRHEARYDIYDLQLRFPEPLVPRQWRLEVQERTDHLGRVLTPVDQGQLADVAARLSGQEIESVAVCFLHSYANPGNEQAVAGFLRSAAPNLYVSISSEVQPEVREYERTSTVVVNAYLQPVMARYVSRIDQMLEEHGYRGRFFLMTSAAGVVRPGVAVRYPVRCLESGPAAGALAAGFFAREKQETAVLSFDMGGTTAKACIIQNAEPEIAGEFEAAREHRFKRGSGIPVKGAAVNMIEIGAGGGSIASINSVGLLQIGPRSAGAAPGPACYGQGGDQPTVTDADLHLGLLNPHAFLGGTLVLDTQASATALGRVAGPLGVTEVDAAWAIHEIVNENMAGAARIHAIEGGHDPGALTLIAFGGAGPVHAAGVAERMGIRRITYPSYAGVASAVGLVVAPLRVDLVRSHLAPLASASLEEAEGIFADLCREAAELLGTTPGQLTRLADMRSRGQGYEITVRLPDSLTHPAAVEAAFRARYRMVFGEIMPSIPIEFVNLRLTAESHGEPAQLPRQAPAAAGGHGPVPSGHRPVYDGNDRTWRPWPVYAFHQLAPGHAFPGPAIVEQNASTIVIRPGWLVSIDAFWNVVAEREAG